MVRRHLVTRGSFHERLADHGDEIVTDDDFAELYPSGRGRPSVPLSVMVRRVSPSLWARARLGYRSVPSTIS